MSQQVATDIPQEFLFAGTCVFVICAPRTVVVGV